MVNEVCILKRTLAREIGRGGSDWVALQGTICKGFGLFGLALA